VPHAPRKVDKSITLTVIMKAITPAPVKPTISLDIFDKIDIRVGTIERVDDIPKSKQLVRFTVDFGDHKRIILAGIKQERETPKEVEGKQALFIVNLEPRSMMDEVSQGMLLDIGYQDKITPVLAVPETPVPNGARLG
jgi:tRNA-binding protein